MTKKNLGTTSLMAALKFTEHLHAFKGIAFLGLTVLTWMDNIDLFLARPSENKKRELQWLCMMLHQTAEKKDIYCPHL